jgi:nucleoside-diphosphate-sugar epimerase
MLLWSIYPQGSNIVATTREDGDLQKRSLMDKWMSEAPDLLVPCAAAIPLAAEGPDNIRAGEINRKIDDNIRFLRAKRNPAIFLSGEVRAVFRKIIREFYRRTMFSEDRIFADLDRNAVCLRISSPYGPRRRYRTVLRIFLERALKCEPLVYFGTGERRQTSVDLEDLANPGCELTICAEIFWKNVAQLFSDSKASWCLKEGTQRAGL